jgi:hypothetical protein
LKVVNTEFYVESDIRAFKDNQTNKFIVIYKLFVYKISLLHIHNYHTYILIKLTARYHDGRPYSFKRLVVTAEFITSSWRYLNRKFNYSAIETSVDGKFSLEVDLRKERLNDRYGKLKFQVSLKREFVYKRLHTSSSNAISSNPLYRMTFHRTPFHRSILWIERHFYFLIFHINTMKSSSLKWLLIKSILR